jgi:very-short-patch-repair endonuclease
VSDSAARARLDRWKQSLLDPNERLLDLGDAGIPFAVDPIRLAFTLAAGGPLSFDSVPLGPDELAERLGQLRRAARAALDDGEHVLWLALGLVTWSDDEGTTRIAPLVLWPVELDHAGSGRIVAAADKRPRVNDMLLEGLRREHELVLETGPDLDLGALLDTITGLALTREGWRVERTARLATFSFARFDLWRDLESRNGLGDVLAAAPVAWLAGETAPPTAIDASASELLAPLDADASQLAAIAAAGNGASFVLQGAPGTGKSQTIANVLVHCASAGKTVLVVSDRASALEVIYQRLCSIGLGELALPLYAGHDTRKDVLGSLVRVLDRSVRLAASTTAGDARLAELRGALDGYVRALHEVGPFGMSLHEVLGKLVELRTTPCAKLAERDAPSLDKAAFERRKRAIAALAEAAVPVEPVATHPWRMSQLDAWPVDGTERATRALNELRNCVEVLTSAIADVSKLVPGIVAKTPDQIKALGALAELASASPRPGAELLTNMRGTRNDEIAERIALIRARGMGTLDVPRDPSAFLAIATRHRALAAEVDDKFTDAIDGHDAGELLAQLKRWTSRMGALRYMALRTARADVRSAAHPGHLQTDAEMISALEAVIAERACRDALLGAAESARRWFGDLFPGGGSDSLHPGGDALSLELGKIEDAVAWGADLRRAFDQLTVAGGEVSKQAAWRALVAQVAASPATDERPAVELAPFARLAAAVARWEPARSELATMTGIKPEWLGAGPDHLAALREQVETLFHAVGSLAEWTKFHLARRDAIVAGAGPAIIAIERGDLGAHELAAAWQRATLIAWAELELAETPELARFHGPSHHAHVAAFADLDRGSLALTRARAVARVADRVPRRNDPDPGIAVLRGELDAQGATGRSLRTVLADLPTLLPRIAPCVLATPHTIAQYLDPALPMFDLVVFDEASRMPVAHALGALSRARAAIVVGDNRQPLPAEGEGLLDVALAAGMPELGLAAHYRSRHEDLFAFANSRYYADKVEVLPAPHASPDLGISWRRIDGMPDAAGANRTEAEAIVADVRARLADPNQSTRSLAIVTMSRAQQELIEDLLENHLSAPRNGERLLIGTPDRLQGEERDVVLVSIGDSADALGVLAHPGGERWLDVAITRAREQMILFSSFAPEDILGDSGCARDLSELLGFARAGGGAGKPAEDVEPASPITAAIARALTDRGWIVKHRVGCGAYKIDLAVVDPNETDRYVLAIEHDGAAYASSNAARSRDRLRAQILTQLGWRLHRVWALDWWVDAEREVQRAHGAIVAAIAASRQRRMAPAPKPLRARASSAPKLAVGSAPVVPPKAAKSIQIEDTLPATITPPVIADGSGPTINAIAGEQGSAPLRLPRGAIAIGPYTAAAVPAGRRAPDDMFAPRYLVELGKCVEQVLATEAPIHIDLLARRVAAYFGIGRVTQRVLEQVQSALLGRGKWGTEKGVVWRLDQDPASVPPVRVAGQSGMSKRDIAEIPLCELAAAVRIIVERVNGVATNDLVRDCARLLGFARMTDKVAERVALGIRLAAARELIAIDSGKAHLLLA